MVLAVSLLGQTGCATTLARRVERQEIRAGQNRIGLTLKSESDYPEIWK
tara:strand:+ start:409 stop:555 length:147 start_codon:yes stop_codon:yes gene_type:complete